MRPYYQDGSSTIYHADCREVLPKLSGAVMVSDVPYGIAYESGSERRPGSPRAIVGDEDTSLRDWALSVWAGPAIIFGSPKVSRPAGSRVLVWDKGGALGMGDLSFPWKLDHEEIYVIGSGFVGRRDCGSVLRYPPEQATGRAHPHQKPVRLMCALIAKCPLGTVIDPFCGSGSTLRAAKDLGRPSIGVEIDERYCEIAARRLAQEVLL